MISGNSRIPASIHVFRSIIAILCAILIVPGDSAWAASAEETTPAAQPNAKLSAQQIDSLVAPVALYPDPLLSQALVAATYPLEIIQLQQWLDRNKDLKDKALTDAAMKQPWDASVQAMAVLPDLVKQLAGNIQWTTDLGNAFLAQQSDVMDAVQRMRAKAQGNGNLKSTEQQKVETKVIENKQTIVIQPASPDVIYVPSYNPTVVYGPPAYPYPPISYPPPGYYAAGMAVSFGVGMMVGAAWGGGWGWNCGWGGNNNIYINNNNNFNRNTNIQGGNNIRGGNRVNPQGGGTWQHNPQHRGAAPYSDRTVANRYGGTARGDSLQSRQAGARENVAKNSRPSAGTTDRGANRAAASSARTTDRGGSRDGSSSARTSDRGAGRGASNAGGGDRVGNRSVPTSSTRSSGAFGGGSSSAARASSSRGSSSFQGGGRSAGSRGGGGRRR